MTRLLKIKKMCFLCLLCLIFVALLEGNAADVSPISEVSGVHQEMQATLHGAFFKAFESPKAFKATRLFQELGYDLAETDLIASVTPRPREVKVKAKLLVEQPLNQKENLAFESLEVECKAVHYYGMLIEEVVFSFPRAVLSQKYLDKGEIRFLKVDEIRLDIKVSETNILTAFNFFIAARGLRKLKMTLADEICRLKGLVQIGFFPVSFEVVGGVELVNPKQINFLCERLEINRQLQPRNYVNALFSRLNPVFNAHGIWLNLNLIELSVVNGFVASKAVITPKLND